MGVRIAQSWIRPSDPMDVQWTTKTKSSGKIARYILQQLEVGDYPLAWYPPMARLG